MTWPSKVSMFMQVTGKMLLVECGNQVNLILPVNDVLLITVCQPMVGNGLIGHAAPYVSLSANQ